MHPETTPDPVQLAHAAAQALHVDLDVHDVPAPPLHPADSILPESDASAPRPWCPDGPRVEVVALGDRIAELSARIQAATWELLSLIRQFDERDGWAGCTSCAEWLGWRTGLEPGAAREHVRVARALADLRRRPPDADPLAGPAPGAERPRPPVPVSGVPARPCGCSPHKALGPRRGDGARQSGPPVPAAPPGGSRRGVPGLAGCGRRRGLRSAGRPSAAGSAGAAGLDGSAVGAGEGAARTRRRLHRPRHPHARLARRAPGPGLGDPPAVASAPAGGDDLPAAAGRPVLTASVGKAVAMAARVGPAHPAGAAMGRHTTRRLRQWLCRQAQGDRRRLAFLSCTPVTHCL